MKTLAIILTFAMTLLLSGCLNLGVGTWGKYEVLKPNFELAEGKNNLAFSRTTHIYTEDEIIAHWGQPDAIETKGCCKILKYREGVSWAGIGAIVMIIPVPLMLPTGHYHNSFYIKEGKCVALVSERGDLTSFFGLLSLDESKNDPKFYFGRPPDYKGPRKVSLDFCKEVVIKP